MRRHRLKGHPSIQQSPVISTPGRMQPSGRTRGTLQCRGEPGTSRPQNPSAPGEHGSALPPCGWAPEPASSPLWCLHLPPQKPGSPTCMSRGDGESRTELSWNTYFSQEKEKINVIVKRKAVLSFVCEVSCTESFISHEISPSCSPTPAAQ